MGARGIVRQQTMCTDTARVRHSLRWRPDTGVTRKTEKEGRQQHFLFTFHATRGYAALVTTLCSSPRFSPTRSVPVSAGIKTHSFQYSCLPIIEEKAREASTQLRAFAFDLLFSCRGGSEWGTPRTGERGRNRT